MRKTILTFGFIAGAILSLMMAVTMPIQDSIADHSLLIGYTTMVLAFLLVYFGVRSWREKAGGFISFGQAFKVGICITAIACCCYVATWEVIYYKFMPDFADRYAARQIEKAKAAGAPESEVEKQRQEMEHFKEMYRNPLANVAMTFLEPLPVGLLMTLLAAGLLRRGRPAMADGPASA